MAGAVLVLEGYSMIGQARYDAMVPDDVDEIPQTIIDEAWDELREEYAEEYITDDMVNDAALAILKWRFGQ